MIIIRNKSPVVTKRALAQKSKSAEREPIFHASDYAQSVPGTHLRDMSRTPYDDRDYFNILRDCFAPRWPRARNVDFQRRLPASKLHVGIAN